MFTQFCNDCYHENELSKNQQYHAAKPRCINCGGTLVQKRFLPPEAIGKIIYIQRKAAKDEKKTKAKSAFDFGMHKGKLIGDIPKSYLEWMIAENAGSEKDRRKAVAELARRNPKKKAKRRPSKKPKRRGGGYTAAWQDHRNKRIGK